VLLLLISLVTADNPFWKVFCDGQPIYRGRADPIVTPGAISGHSHRVFGASNFGLGVTDPIAEYNNMMQSSCTTCSLSVDKTAYWVPDLYYQWPDGSFSLVPTAGLTVYYPSRSGSGAQANPKYTAFPPGFRMLAGTPTRRTFNASDNTNLAISYACLGNSPSPQTNIFPADITQCVYGFRAQLWFPMCWDGVNIDSPTHKSHVSYPIEAVDGGNCPSTHPVRLPGVFFEVLFSITSFPKQNYNPFRWSCGDATGNGYHGDFLSGWNQEVLQAALTDPTCFAQSTNNGNNVAACNTLAPHIIADHSKCTISHPIPNIEDLGYNHPLLKLPGCNPIVTGGSCPGPEPSYGPNWRRFLLQNKNSGLFVGAKDSLTDLTASVVTPSYSEVWVMVSNGNGQYAIKSELTGQYVTSPRGDPLICNRGSAQAWEFFIFTAVDSTYYSIQSLSNNLFTSLSTADGTLHSDSNTVGDLQKWKLVDPGIFIPGGSGPESSFSAHAVSDLSANNFSPSTSAAPFPYWIIGVVVGVVVVLLLIVVVVVITRSRKGKMESV